MAMPSTRKQIEEMTDEGRFEQLALAALRRMKPDCEAVIHEGMNADGKTIQSCVDAEGIVPGSNPPRYVMIACTTTKREKLRKKWLFDYLKPESYAVNPRRSLSRKRPPEAKDDGDLFKAIRRAQEKRKELPDATFK